MVENAPTQDPIIPAEDAGATGRFARAIDDARAGAQGLRDDAAELAALAREKAAETAAEWTEQAGAYLTQARETGADFANQGKARTSEAIAWVGKGLAGTAPTIDEKLGVQYGDYARQAGQSLEQVATSLDERSFAELGEDIRTFVRNNPATAVGIAAATGFVLARLIRRPGKDEA